MRLGLAARWVVLGALVWMPAAVRAQAPAEEAAAFFERYRALAEAYDPALADLYADEARVSTLRRYPDGQRREVELTGAQWKAMIRQAMPLARAAGDRSVFSAVQVETDGPGQASIRARREVPHKCYTDTGYALQLARGADGTWRIVAEHMNTQPHSNCP